MVHQRRTDDTTDRMLGAGPFAQPSTEFSRQARARAAGRLAGVITFLVGGARSGKSTLAVEIGRRSGGPVTVIATAEPFDDDLRQRIARHRAERPAWPTIEAPLDLAAGVLAAARDHLLIVDCVTVWVGNLLHHDPTAETGPRLEALLAALRDRTGDAVVISNEVGLGLVPDNTLGRHFRDQLGLVNQAIARAADRTALLAAGRAVRLEDPWDLL